LVSYLVGLILAFLFIVVIILAIIYWQITLSIIGVIFSIWLTKRIIKNHSRQTIRSQSRDSQWTNRRIRLRRRSMQRHLVTINGRAHELTDVQFVDLNNFRSEVSRLEPKEYDDFLTTWTAKLVDSSKRGNMLYEIKGIIPKKKFKMLRYVDP